MRGLYGEDGIDEAGWERAMAEPLSFGAPPTCDRRGCLTPATGAVSCDCGAVYQRCEAHGSGAGARRSLHSHRALQHARGSR
jgi:hypothetical protein